MGSGVNVDQYNALMEQYGSFATTIYFIAFFICAIGCFFGYKLTKVIIAICGFLLGMLAGAAVGVAANSPGLVLPVGVLLGILFAVIAYKAYKVGVFIMSFFTTGLFALGFFSGVTGHAFDKKPLVLIAVGVIVGIVDGVVAVILTKPVLIITTSLSYGMGCGSCLAMATKHLALALPIGIVFVVLGIIIQIKTNDGLLERPESKPLSQNYNPQQYVNPYAMPGQGNPQFGQQPQQPQQNGQYNDYLGNRRF